VLEVERHGVVGVDTRRHDDVEVDLLRDPLDPGDVTADADDGGVDDRVVAGSFHLLELGDGVGDPLLLVPLVVVQVDVRGEHEDVLVHEHAAELRGVDGAGDGGDSGHVPQPTRLSAQCRRGACEDDAVRTSW
jgi:hypothetical protein